jgi:hypothetical protein
MSGADRVRGRSALGKAERVRGQSAVSVYDTGPILPAIVGTYLQETTSE